MQVSASISLPEMLLASPRKHNAIVRGVLRSELERHHREVMPRHFAPGNAAKYHHMARSPRYLKNKARYFHSTTDLVKTRATQKAFALAPAKNEITLAGSASNETLIGKLKKRLPFAGGTGIAKDDGYWARLEKALGAARSATLRRELQERLGRRHGARGRTGVTPQQIVKELQTITRDEANETTRRLGDGYIRELKSMKRPRLAVGKTLPSV